MFSGQSGQQISEALKIKLAIILSGQCGQQISKDISINQAFVLSLAMNVKMVKGLKENLNLLKVILFGLCRELHTLVWIHGIIVYPTILMCKLLCSDYNFNWTSSLFISSQCFINLYAISTLWLGKFGSDLKL